METIISSINNSIDPSLANVLLRVIFGESRSEFRYRAEKKRWRCKSRDVGSICAKVREVPGRLIASRMPGVVRGVKHLFKLAFRRGRSSCATGHAKRTPGVGGGDPVADDNWMAGRSVAHLTNYSRSPGPRECSRFSNHPRWIYNSRQS